MAFSAKVSLFKERTKIQVWYIDMHILSRTFSYTVKIDSVVL